MMQELMVKKQLVLVLKVWTITLLLKMMNKKKRYLDRHRKNENWNDHNTAGFYAKNLLWNKKTLTASIRDTNSKFKNIKIKYA